MSGKQKSLIAVLVLSNLIVYTLGFFAWQTLPAAEPTSPSPDQIAERAVSPPPTFTLTRTPTPTLTSTPPPTPTPTTVPPTATATPKPAATYRPVVKRINPSPTRVPTQSPTSSAANSSGPLLPGDDWRMLAPNASVMYTIGQGGNKMQAVLQSQHLDALRMEVFAPNVWDHPIGVGSLQRGLDGLVWSGGSWGTDGDWMARVTNAGPAAVQYRLVVSSQAVGCDMTGYWEYIGKDYVYWRKCK